MARNEEKALTLFNKWQTFKREYHSSAGNRRPLSATGLDSLTDAEKWRRQIISDITKKVSAIQNASLGEHKIRDMNDEINKLMRQKHYCEIRIREMGGDTTKGRNFVDVEGQELPGAPGYRYYGAAKSLPGVRELFASKSESAESKRHKRSRVDIYKNINADYYGCRDDDDGILKQKEAEREKELIAKSLEQFNDRKKRLLEEVNSKSSTVNAADLDILEDSDEDELLLSEELSNNNTINNVQNSIPTQNDLNALVIEQKKKLLLEKLSGL